MTFEFTTTVDVRYDDLDTYGHVNNVRYGTYLEEARIDYLAEVVARGDRSYLSAEGEGTGIVIANLELDYERPVRSAEAVTVGVRVPHLGTKSFPFEYEVRDGDAVAATGETTVVTYDREAEAPQEIPEDWREAITQFEGL
ncbi:acyl-CoA thioesterase [Halomicroarcula sp. S1AR25-4]|uniref:acyl-CoA thioesterase n=1 Tax=Haloarcula sp. S1AR25-4 TaxID=2950538 RepID=UPI002875018E|nr:thioesterase family protein [Halomicroarcula sp. S1AR25-4]MDS0277641.1 acyl-CoA thioesterase [Halomicroarcula sp. S1AR25-4]